MEVSVQQHVAGVLGQRVLVEHMPVRKRHFDAVRIDLRDVDKLERRDHRVDFAVAIALDDDQPVLDRIEHLRNLERRVLVG